MTPAAPQLRARAEAEAAALPALMLGAQRLAAAVQPGAHGLRRAGRGDEFWQYRAAAPGDAVRQIDWRRSARSDASFVREHETQRAQAAVLWLSSAPGMDWTGDPARPTKRDRARLLALALGLLLLRGGERVALAGDTPRAGRIQGDRLARQMLSQGGAADDGDAPAPDTLRPAQHMILIGDFLSADIAPLTMFLDRAAAMGVGGVVMQVLDPAEQDFPFQGAVRFRSVSGAARFQTRNAAGLHAAYAARLAERRAVLARATGAAGWQFGTHDTAAPPAAALLWLYAALGA